jgi:D-alanyl-lipoteichoic acid acyltransferase DltB (MBOAT superfamily)/ethanolamine utilization microcompartment shell protein EutS
LDGTFRGPGVVQVDAEIRSGAIHVGLLDRERNVFVGHCVLRPGLGSGSIPFDEAQGRSLILSNAAGGQESEAVFQMIQLGTGLQSESQGRDRRSLASADLRPLAPDFQGVGTTWDRTDARLVTNRTTGYQVRWPLDGTFRGPGVVQVDAEIRSGAIHVGLLDRERNVFVGHCVLRPGLGSGSIPFDEAQGRSLILSNAAGGQESEAVFRAIAVNRPHATRAKVVTAADTLREDQRADSRYAGSPPYLFSSWEFVFLFLPATLTAVAMTTRRVGLLVGTLVAASMIWYSAWDVRFAPLIVASIVGNWLLGKWVGRTGSKGALTVAVLLNLIPLAWFKYTNFAFTVVGLDAGDWILPDFLPAVLPLGISFYTFQQIGYVVDVRTCPDKQEPSLWRYALFVLFFPQLVAGPIVQHGQFLPQLGKSRDMPTWFARGCAYFAIGVAKKLMVADPIGSRIEPLFSSGGCADASQALAAIVGYGSQLYFDFSAYSDMAIGLGAMFGFEIPVNFRSPYQATSVTDFWRRWHITLSTFLRDYVYIPLGGNRGKSWTRYRNLILTMLIGGLWHGAGWAFVLWGGMHGILLAIEHLFRSKFPRVTFGWAARPMTLLAVFMLWVPFRTEDMTLALEIVSRLFVPGWKVDPVLFGYCAVSMGIALAAPNSHVIVPRLSAWPIRVRRMAWGLARRSGAYAILALAILSILISTYYANRWDARAQQHGISGSTARGIVNNRGDLRNNMLRVEVLAHPGPKWVVAGPSFASGMPTLEVVRPGAPSVIAGSAGIGGQSLGNWGRTAMAVCDFPGVEVVLVAVSPIALTGAIDGEPFRSQGWDLMELTGIRPEQRDPLATLGPTRLSPIDAGVALLTADVMASRWFQLHGFARLLVDSVFASPVGAKHLTSDVEALAGATLNEWRAGPRSSVADPLNGRDDRFGWTARGVLESLAPGGAARKALAALRTHAASRGIRLVVYDTPTVAPADADGFYPTDFWRDYARAIRLACAESQIEYWDLSGYLPWSGVAMNDFIHPTSRGRELVLIELCRRLRDSATGGGH